MPQASKECLHGCMHCNVIYLNASHTCRKNACRLRASGGSLNSPLKCANPGPREGWFCSSALSLLKGLCTFRYQIVSARIRYVLQMFTAPVIARPAPCGLSWCEICIEIAYFTTTVVAMLHDHSVSSLCSCYFFHDRSLPES